MQMSDNKRNTLAIVVNKWLPGIQAAATNYGVPWTRVAAIVATESGGNESARNGLSIGLMQIEPIALQDFNSEYHTSYSIESLNDAGINMNVGTGYLALLRKRLNNDLDLATQAYNGGIGNVLKDNSFDRVYLTRVKEFEQYL
jgi:soluble lytic murein transglycosylase-like protein